MWYNGVTKEGDKALPAPNLQAKSLSQARSERCLTLVSVALGEFDFPSFNGIKGYKCLLLMPPDFDQASTISIK